MEALDVLSESNHWTQSQQMLFLQTQARQVEVVQHPALLQILTEDINEGFRICEIRCIFIKVERIVAQVEVSDNVWIGFELFSDSEQMLR